MPEIQVIEQRDEGRSYFTLEHPFDVSTLEVSQIGDLFDDRYSAEQAAAWLGAAVGGSSD